MEQITVSKHIFDDIYLICHVSSAERGPAERPAGRKLEVVKHAVTFRACNWIMTNDK